MTVLTFDQAVTALQKRTGLDRESCVHMVRRSDEYAPRAVLAPDPELEDDVVGEGDRMMQSLGFTVIRFSQKRRSKVTEGIPDRRYYHLRRKIFLWWEAKSPTGRQRPDQRAFQLICDMAGDPYVLGGLEELRAWLTANRVATFDASGLPQPIPFTEVQR